MTNIEFGSFLSQEAEERRNAILEAYPEAFLLAKEINRNAMALIREYELNLIDKTKIVICVLMVRIIETFQGIILLLERGMTSQARILVCSQLEAFFCMAAIAKDPDLYSSYVAQGNLSVINAHKAAKRLKQKSLKGRLSPEKINELMVNSETKRETTKAKILKVNQWAQKAKFDDFYNLFYVENSGAVHPDIWALDDQVAGDRDQGVQVNFGPNDIDLYHVLRTAIHVMFPAIEIFSDIQRFSVVQRLEISEIIGQLNRRALVLDKKYYIDPNKTSA